MALYVFAIMEGCVSSFVLQILPVFVSHRVLELLTFCENPSPRCVQRQRNEALSLHAFKRQMKGTGNHYGWKGTQINNYVIFTREKDNLSSQKDKVESI